MDISDPDGSPGGRGRDEIPGIQVVQAAKYDTIPPPDASEGKKMVGEGTTPVAPVGHMFYRNQPDLRLILAFSGR
jgi:hypothetical protein